MKSLVCLVLAASTWLQSAMRQRAACAAVLLTMALAATPARAVTIDWSPVGSPGNPADTATSTSGDGTSGYGSVAYNYRIGTYDVTNAQYTEFLNTKDPSGANTLGLWNEWMADVTYGGIEFMAGNTNGAKYTLISGAQNHPVNWVSWYDAIRFANWLNNGQGSGDTETGAYTLGPLDASGVPLDGDSIVRNAGAIVFLPNENEWYKAAYYDANTSSYFAYPTSSNTAPSGDFPPGGSNSANYAPFNFDPNVDNLTDVGAYSGTTSPFGAFDMAGNVFQWTDDLVVLYEEPFRVLRGDYYWSLSPARRGFVDAWQEISTIGFRVASVPEPSTFALAALGGVGLLALRKRRRAASFGTLMAVLLLSGTSKADAITIDTVPVGNAGNAGELSGAGAGGSGPDSIVGGVSYDYRIGTYEITNAQYAAFLTEKAKSDPLGLYNALMGSNITYGGITRSGVSGSFTYAPKTNMGDKPVNFVSWYDSIRFANWLNNGQGIGDTETGAYTLLGGTPIPSNGLSITRNVGATWFLTSEDEWYKAAYHQPTAQGGDSDSYWLYPTRTNSVPTLATANSVGDISNPGANVANYDRGAKWNGPFGTVTTVGSAGVLSNSFYGTADQGGNVMEWNEAVFNSSLRGIRGSAYEFSSSTLQASFRGYTNPTGEYGSLGFRVAMVPEPSTFALGALGVVGLAVSAKRRRLR